MSAVKKVFKKVVKSKIFKTVVVVVAAWYLAGVAGAYFNGPQSVGLADAMSASGQSMWSSVAGETGYQSAAEIGAEMSAGGSAGAGAGAGAGVSNVGAVSQEGTIAETGLAQPVTPAMEESAYQASLETGAGTTTDLAAKDLAAKEAGGGYLDAAGKWMKANPMATGIIASGISGAAGEYMAGKNQPGVPDYGTMGFDKQGRWQGTSRQVEPSVRPGIIGGAASATEGQVVAGPGGQVVARPGATTPVAKNKLASVIKRPTVAGG